MMYVAYTSGYTVPRHDVASRVLRRAAPFSPGRDKGGYWLAAIADFGLTRAQLLPQGVPVLTYVTYRLSLTFRPAGLVADQENGTAPLLPNTASALGLPRLIQPQDQGRNYLPGPQEAIYEEMMASRKLAVDDQPALNLVPLSLAEITTHDLAGWTTPQRGASSKQMPHAAPTPTKRASRNSRHNEGATRY